MTNAPKLAFQTVPPVFMLSVMVFAYVQTDFNIQAPLFLMYLILPVVILNWLFGIRAKTIKQNIQALVLAILLPILIFAVGATVGIWGGIPMIF